MVYTEAVMIAITVLVFTFQEYSLDFGVLTTGPSLLAFLLLATAHSILFIEIARREFFPYKTLRLSSFNSLFYRALVGSSLFLFVFLFLLDVFFPIEYSRGSLLIATLQHFELVAFKMLFVFFFLQFQSMDDRTRSRLSFRTALIGLKLIDRKDKSVSKERLVSNYLRWFSSGLNSYSSYLYTTNPKRIGITGISDYNRSIYCVGLFGNRAERTTVARHVRFALDSMGGRLRKRDLRQFLIALQNIKNVSDKRVYPVSELIKMVKVISSTERAKEWLSSPWLTTIISVIAVVIGIFVAWLK
jgi:hypothetical protein